MTKGMTMQEEERHLREGMKDALKSADMEKVMTIQQKINNLVTGKLLLQEWAISEEEWQGLSRKIQTVIISLSKDANRYSELRCDLQEWLGNCP